MSQNSFSAFKAKLAADETFRQELSRVLGPDGSAEALTTFARERGYDFEPDEIKSAVQELSDDELDAVAGGTSRLLRACTSGEHFKKVVITH